MLIYRKSPISGRINTMSIDVTQEQIDLWIEGELIQNAFPSHITAGEREFIKTGITPSEWELI